LSMDIDRPMYVWRRLTPAQREAVMEERKQYPRPWHGPPHHVAESGLYLLSAACYEHRPVIGFSPQRMAAFEAELLETVHEHCEAVFAWVVLPNHYHLLAQAPDIEGLLSALGRLHGRTSFRWNGEEICRGRQVWHRAAETEMKS